VSTRRKAATAVIGLAVPAVLGTFGWTYWVGGPVQLNNGEGALEAGGAGHAFDAKYGPVWTIGFLVCVNPGFDSVTLDGTVGGTSELAGDLALVGALAGQVKPGTGGIVDSAEGFPPQTGPHLSPARGYVVTTPCDHTPNSTAPLTLLAFGVRAPADNLGAGWEGIQIGYTVHGFHHVVTTDETLFVCGSGMPVDVCPDPMPHA
jgi:hypothetical protein